MRKLIKLEKISTNRKNIQKKWNKKWLTRGIFTCVAAIALIGSYRYISGIVKVSSNVNGKELPIYCKLGEKEEQLMEQAFHRLHLTARTYHRILKVSRTIADMEGVDRIRTKHIKEALGYRTLEKKYWGR